MQLQLRRTAVPDDLDVAPENARRMACAERLHRRFLRGEPAGKMNRRDPPARAVGDLAVREDASQETVPVPFNRLGNPGDVGGVEAEADDVWHDVVNGA